MELSTISKRIFTGGPKPTRVTLKHHVFNTHIPKNLFKAKRDHALNDKKGEFNQEISYRRVGGMHISKIPSDLSEMDFVDYGDEARCLHLQYISRVTRL